MLHEEITNKILKAFFLVNKTLGFGFLEKVYENALAVELRRLGCKVLQQQKIRVFYEKEQVGEYFTDLLVDDKVIVELKAAEKLHKEHEAQLINYLKAAKTEVGLLLNYGRKAEYSRKIFTNDRK